MTTEHRKRLHRYEIPGHARSHTFSCLRRLPLFHEDWVKDAFVEQLALTRKRLEFRLFAWVVMPEHAHVLLLPNLETATVSRISTALKRPFAGDVLERWRVVGDHRIELLFDSTGAPTFWQPGGGYDRNIHSKEELREKINYIHRNPVVRGLVKRQEDWRWSSARWYAGDRDEGPDIDRV